MRSTRRGEPRMKTKRSCWFASFKNQKWWLNQFVWLPRDHFGVFEGPVPGMHVNMNVRHMFAVWKGAVGGATGETDGSESRRTIPKQGTAQTKRGGILASALAKCPRPRPWRSPQELIAWLHAITTPWPPHRTHVLARAQNTLPRDSCRTDRGPWCGRRPRLGEGSPAMW